MKNTKKDLLKRLEALAEHHMCSPSGLLMQLETRAEIQRGER